MTRFLLFSGLMYSYIAVSLSPLLVAITEIWHLQLIEKRNLTSPFHFPERRTTR